MADSVDPRSPVVTLIGDLSGLDIESLAAAVVEAPDGIAVLARN